MFENCTNLEYIDASDWDLSNVTTINAMIKGTGKLKVLRAPNWHLNSITGSAVQEMFGSRSRTTKYNMPHIDVEISETPDSGMADVIIRQSRYKG